MQVFFKKNLSRSIHPHPWIEPTVRNICQNIDHNQNKGNKQQRAHHHRKIVFSQTIHHHHAHAFPIEHVFNKHRPCHQRSKPTRNSRYHGVHNVFQGMARYHFIERQAFGFCGADVVLRKHFERRTSRKLHYNRQRTYAQGESRQK